MFESVQFINPLMKKSKKSVFLAYSYKDCFSHIPYWLEELIYDGVIGFKHNNDMDEKLDYLTLNGSKINLYDYIVKYDNNDKIYIKKFKQRQKEKNNNKKGGLKMNIIECIKLFIEKDIKKFERGNNTKIDLSIIDTFYDYSFESIVSEIKDIEIEDFTSSDWEVSRVEIDETEEKIILDLIKDPLNDDLTVEELKKIARDTCTLRMIEQEIIE
jgi:hypothetical protein